MLVRRLLYPTLALALVSVACQPAAQQTAALSDDDVAAIQLMLDGVLEGELAGDWNAVAKNFAEDFVYLPANMQPIEGRAAWLLFVQGAELKIAELSAEILELDGRGDLAFARGVYSEILSMGDAEPTEDEGKFVWILRKQADGSWKVVVAIGNSNLPLDET